MYYGVHYPKASSWIVNRICVPGAFSWISLISFLMLLCATQHPVHADKNIIYEFRDNITANTPIGNIKRASLLHRRLESSVLRTLTFEFLPQTVHNADQRYFRLRSDTGELFAARNIDRDEICGREPSCILYLDVAVQPATEFRVLRVMIILHDDNDNAPKFPKRKIDFTVSENVPPGDLLFIDQAVDPDIEEFSVQRYEMTGDKDFFDFEETDTGNLRVMLLQNLNREEKEIHELTITAFDGGQPPKTGNVSIRIIVEDINDNTPKFIEPAMDINISEDTRRGSVLLYVNAIDLDKGNNGKLQYSFTNDTERKYGSTFRLNARTGKLTLTRPLDREIQSQYALSVVARDNGAFSIPAEAKIFINVLDVNDNVPQISVSPLEDETTLVVLENAEEGSFIAHVSALDADADDNGLVNCSLLSSVEGAFRLNKLYDGEYKLLTNRLFDRETMDEYEITIRCHDFGFPQETSVVSLSVIIADVNDHIPMFEKDMYNCAIFENSPEQNSLLTVKAREPDSGLNGFIEYSLGREAGNVFRINRTTGVITAVTSFDREKIGDRVEFRVFAADQGFIPHTATASIQVIILDVDDERPQFTQTKYIFDIVENLPPDTLIGIVSANDNDLPPHRDFTFYLDPSRTNASWFNIDPKTGIIRSKISFDRETIPVHDVYVLVKGDVVISHTDEALVQVYVTDVNDNKPNITKPNINKNKVYVSSDTRIGTSFSQIEAHDLDKGVNRMLTYHFTNDSSSLFVINENTGNISVAGNIRHYVHELFLVKVVVKDKGDPQKWSSTVFYIIVSNKLSQTNTWDKYRMTKDRGLSLEWRVAILVIVTILSTVSIIVCSILIRLYRLHKKPTEQYADNHSHTNGVIPSSSHRSLASSAEYSSVHNDDVFYVKSRKRSKSTVSMSTSASASNNKDSPSDALVKENPYVSDVHSDDEADESSDLMEKQPLPDDNSDPQSPQRRKSVHFEEAVVSDMNSTLKTPSSDSTLWNSRSSRDERVKHSIPGVCNIIAASSDDLYTQTQYRSCEQFTKYPGMPNEIIRRYSMSLVTENEHITQCSPPPIPNHVPPPICIKAASTMPVRHVKPYHNNIGPGRNKLLLNHTSPKRMLPPVYSKPHHPLIRKNTYNTKTLPICRAQRKTKTPSGGRRLPQIRHNENPEDSDGSYI